MPSLRPCRLLALVAPLPLFGMVASSILVPANSNLFVTPSLAFLMGPPPTAFLRVHQHKTPVSSFRLFQSTNSHPPGSGNLEEEEEEAAAAAAAADRPWDQNRPKYNISLLLIDHYDSFTYNLYDYFAQLLVEPPTVIAKDAYDDYEQLLCDYNEDVFDGIVLSPGPGTPQQQPALSHQAISHNPDLPVLGVCLGHQLLALEYGAHVDTAPTPIHGQDHWISQEQQEEGKEPAVESCSSSSPLFQGLPPSFRVVRYHSLAALEADDNDNQYAWPHDSLRITARSHGDHVVQAMQHVDYPHYGVQFHPESIGTQHGMALLENFCRIVESHKTQKKQAEGATMGMNEKDASVDPTSKEQSTTGNSNDDEVSSSSSSSSTTPLPLPRFRVVAHPFSTSPDITPERVFEALYEPSSHAMWLDSSSASTQQRGEVDILAAPASSRDILEYHYDDEHSSSDILTQLEEELFGRTNSNNNNNSDRASSLRRPASKELAILHDLSHPIIFQDELTLTPTTPTLSSSATTNSLPFDYRGGFLGFLGYEVRYDTERYLHQVEGGRPVNHPAAATTTDEASSSSDTPTAAFFLARNSLVYHHPTQTWYMISLVEQDDDHPAEDGVLEWMKTTKDRILRLSSSSRSSSRSEGPKATITVVRDANSIEKDEPPLQFTPNRSKSTYEKDIAQCHEFIRKGDSYELCLTNQLEASLPARGPAGARSTWDLYKILRRRNPAPYSAFFRWNHQAQSETSNTATDLTICCSSPERFMSVKRKQPHPEVPMVLQAEAKPIKGTEARVMPQNGVSLTESEEREDQRRARSLELSLKNRAENLMIVDLLRNDLSRVCQVGSVHVAKLMAIESFATVHQMVSTIRGTLATVVNEEEAAKNGRPRPASTSIDLLRAAFPGGSMTGAPKIRTMELLEELEQNVDRGPYAGSLGYLSVNGCMDMNIIIRSAVVTSDKDNGQRIRIGAGGAITALSETQDEYEEMLLKARAVVQSVQAWAAEPRRLETEMGASETENEENTAPLSSP